MWAKRALPRESQPIIFRLALTLRGVGFSHPFILTFYSCRFFHFFASHLSLFLPLFLFFLFLLKTGSPGTFFCCVFVLHPAFFTRNPHIEKINKKKLKKPIKSQITVRCCWAKQVFWLFQMVEHRQPAWQRRCYSHNVRDILYWLDANALSTGRPTQAACTSAQACSMYSTFTD